MNLSSFLSARLSNQQLQTSSHESIKHFVSEMGAMQAQDFAMSKWAVGIRLHKPETAVETALNKGEILRMHVLRPTWHLVAAEDAYWMLQLTALGIRAALKSRDKQLEITDALYKKANKIIEKALRQRHHTGKELVDELKKKNIDVSGNRSGHFMMRAELDGIVSSGEIRQNTFTYALFDERVTNKTNYNREEALQALATRYFTTHGPAKATDFAWWAGLTGKDATFAVNNLDNSFVKETFQKETYWLKQDAAIATKENKVLLLPAFDEYIISYKDRAVILSDEHTKHIISSNGIFWPVVLVNGKVAGKWNRRIVKDHVHVEVNLFHSLSTSSNKKLLKAAVDYAEFIDKKLIIIKPI